MIEGRKVLWLLEEPESYLHPHLASSCNAILENLAKDAIVLKTTHSMAFVPQDPAYVCGTKLNKNGRTEIVKFESFQEAVASIRTALGIKFGDFYNLAKYNVLVEGKSDREIFQWFLKRIPIEQHPWTHLREAKFEDFGGVKHLGGFLRATYQFIRNEQACVAVFDGDEAGEFERKALQGFFGQKEIPFNSNEHFVSVRARFSIEGLFPDEWIRDINEEHPTWFETYSVDVAGQLEPFKIKDARKGNVQEMLMSLADDQVENDWANRFFQVCNVLDAALGKLSNDLAH